MMNFRQLLDLVGSSRDQIRGLHLYQLTFQDSDSSAKNYIQPGFNFSDLFSLIPAMVFNGDPVMSEAIKRFCLSNFGAPAGLVKIRQTQLYAATIYVTSDYLNLIDLPSVASLRLLIENVEIQKHLKFHDESFQSTWNGGLWYMKFIQVIYHFFFWWHEEYYSRERLCLYLDLFVKLLMSSKFLYDVAAKGFPMKVVMSDEVISFSTYRVMFNAFAMLYKRRRDSGARLWNKFKDPLFEAVMKIVKLSTGRWNVERQQRNFELQTKTDLLEAQVDGLVRKVLETCTELTLEDYLFARMDREQRIRIKEVPFSYQWLAEILSQISYPTSTARSVVELCSEDDASLMKVLNNFVQLQNAVSHLQEATCPFAPFIPSADVLFIHLMETLGFDDLLVMDWLLSSETNMLTYLTHYLKIGGANPTADYGEHFDTICVMLRSLRDRLTKAMEGSLMPYNASPLIRLITAFLSASESCSAGGDA